MRSQARSSKTVPPAAARVVFSKKEYASSLGVSVDSVNRRIKAGDIRIIRFGRRILIPADELSKLLKT